MASSVLHNPFLPPQLPQKYTFRRRRKQIWSVEAHAVPHMRAAKRWKEINFAVHSAATIFFYLMSNKAFFQRCIISFLDLPAFQYNIQLHWLRRRSQETAQLAFVACSSLFENLY